MTLIEHAEYLDLRTLAETAREAASIMEDLNGAEENENYDSEELLEALETLQELEKLANAIGLDVDSEDFDTIGDELDRWGNGYEPTLIAESYWVDYCKEFCSDLGYLPENLPDFISNNINWEGVADDLADDYEEVSFDGHNYMIRKA